MNDQERYDNGMQVRRAVLGDAHVDRTLTRRNEFNDDFQNFITRFAWGDVWTRPGLTRHMRSMVTLSLLIALNRGDEFRMHVRAAFNNGVTREEMKELFMHAALYCGLPAANQAIHDAETVFAEMEAAEPGSTTRARDAAQR
ncbi:4-carboxymuconolactone decarboxylase [Pandoraea cepalis]|uniref:4-carboxymuconolactone decarboxylase n=2 Tax=Pandoraea TaxID=93217 RepID=A0A5E4UMM1_9BURK|nr:MULTISPECIES: 4-carboxymuconolactone decarboxylase [Pandoraea]MDN4573848.1 4-carboxymuconolactone decarboxylase [Pandoraea cepalis]MDN4580384.1 4-carboxymuconolactone decarboxylase [Pandoraea cepalis]VVE01157.1 4-carboxymuconolactone decarboxylase [Pandoraea cepalis]VVE21633.1 4-carboxymuconolactone decarboxylase [Pandoraea soli]VVE23190.1 4-carboxymuconolactone decarboxylase [Pandoraea cepalis]